MSASPKVNGTPTNGPARAVIGPKAMNTRMNIKQRAN